MKKILRASIIAIFSIFTLLIFQINIFAESNYIIDNAGIFTDKETLEINSKTFETKNNISIYYYTVNSATQEQFEQTMEEYSANKKGDFVLFYIAKDSLNVGIYTSENLITKITDADKMLLLKSMENYIFANQFDNAMICASQNLEKILETKKDSELQHEQLTLDLEQKEKQRIISLGLMVIFGSIFIINIIFLLKDFFKKKNNATNKDS